MHSYRQAPIVHDCVTHEHSRTLSVGTRPLTRGEADIHSTIGTCAVVARAIADGVGV